MSRELDDPNDSEIDPLDLYIGGSILQRRRETHLKQKDVELATGIDRTKLSRIERGKQTTTQRELRLIAQALGCTLYDIVVPAYDRYYREKGSKPILGRRYT